jgi:hypothetical protein
MVVPAVVLPAFGKCSSIGGGCAGRLCCWTMGCGRGSERARTTDRRTAAATLMRLLRDHRACGSSTGTGRGMGGTSRIGLGLNDFTVARSRMPHLPALT